MALTDIYVTGWTDAPDHNSNKRQHAFAWHSGVGMVDLHTLYQTGGGYGGDSTGRGVNQRGDVVGESDFDNTGAKHAFYYNHTGNLYDLHAMTGGLADQLDATTSRATGISNGGFADEGIIVGWYTKASDANYHAFMYDTGSTTAFEINPATYSSVKAGGITADGLIFGWASTNYTWGPDPTAGYEAYGNAGLSSFSMTDMNSDSNAVGWGVNNAHNQPAYYFRYCDDPANNCDTWYTITPGNFGGGYDDVTANSLSFQEYIAATGYVSQTVTQTALAVWNMRSVNCPWRKAKLYDTLTNQADGWSALKTAMAVNNAFMFGGKGVKSGYVHAYVVVLSVGENNTFTTEYN